jgi:hypothetical protein
MTLIISKGLTLDNGQKPAAVAGVMPTLDYRFAREKREIETVSLTDKLIYTGENGTFVGSDGFIQRAITNVPRFDHDPETGECLGLLVEEQRTNLLTYSEDFENAVWQTTNPGEVTLIAGVADPAGGNNATTFYHDSGAGDTGWLRRIISGTSGQPYSLSFWARRRAGTGNLIAIVGDNINQNINGVTSNWQRFSIVNAPTSSLVRSYIKVDSAGDQFDIWGAQLEAGAFPTSYIKTENLPLIRTVDNAVIDGTGVLTGTYTLIEKPAGCAIESGGNIVLQSGYTAERVMVFPSALTAGQITNIRSVM